MCFNIRLIVYDGITCSYTGVSAVTYKSIQVNGERAFCTRNKNAAL